MTILERSPKRGYERQDGQGIQ